MTVWFNRSLPWRAGGILLQQRWNASVKPANLAVAKLSMSHGSALNAHMIHVCHIACSVCPNKLLVWFSSSSVSWWSCRVICFQMDGCVGFDWDIPHDHCFIHIDHDMVSARVVPTQEGSVDQYVRVKCGSGMCTNSQTYLPEIPFDETCIHDFIAIIMAPWLVFAAQLAIVDLLKL